MNRPLLSSAGFCCYNCFTFLQYLAGISGPMSQYSVTVPSEITDSQNVVNVKLLISELSRFPDVDAIDFVCFGQLREK